MFKNCIIFVGAALLTGAALANPEGGVVTSGSASIQQAPGSTVIQQNSQQAIINWQSFNIGSNESTHFQQPTNGIALNRINPQQGASQIFGQLSATGKIILVNQAGIFFGSGARVDVGGIIASTSDISNANFLAGNYIFDQVSPSAGSIINKGTIIAAQHGLVALMGTGVRNDGLIQADLGKVVLASGNTFTMSFSNDDLINFTVNSPATHAGIDQNGNMLKDGVNNSGSIIADGGKILMTAQAAQGVVDNVINMSGIAQANSILEQNGEIVLQGDNEGVVLASGTLEASGKQAGQTGGIIKILGNEIALNNNANIDVSGNLGGGEILIGGNAHGAGPEQNANYTFVGSLANLNASALTEGDGGKIVVWSNQGTQFYGNILAQGGSQSGNGGWVETSGGNLIFAGKVNTSASNGKTGSLLLDPTDMTIQNGANGSGNLDTTAVADSGIVFTDTGSTLSVGAIQAIGNTNITLQASNSISLAAATNLNLATDGSPLGIGHTLTLQSGDTSTVGGGNITFGAGASIETLGGDVVLIAGDSTTQHTGTATVGVINTHGGALTITSQSGTILTGNLTASSIDVTGPAGNIEIQNSPTFDTSNNPSGTQTYDRPVILDNNSNLNLSGSAAITFNNTIDADATASTTSGLQITNSGVTNFYNSIGATNPLQTIIIGGAGDVAFNNPISPISGYSVNTIWYQEYNGGNIFVSGPAANVAGVTFNATGGGSNSELLFFNTGVIDTNSSASHLAQVAFNADGSVFIQGNIGDAVGISAISINTPSSETSGTAFTTQGYGQTYNTNLRVDTSLTLTDTNSLGGNGTIHFLSGSNVAAGDLSIQDPKGIILEGDFGDGVPLNSLTIGSPSDSSPVATQIGNGSFSFLSVAGDTTFNDPVVLESGSTVFISTSSNLLFNSTIDGTATTETLDIQDISGTPGSGTTTFLGDIGSNVNLLSINVERADNIIFNSPTSPILNFTVNTTGNQGFGSNTEEILISGQSPTSAGVTFNSSGGTFTFVGSGGVDTNPAAFGTFGAAQLAINVPQLVQLQGSLGATNGLASFTLNSGTEADISGPIIRTLGLGQTYSLFQLLADTTFIDTGALGTGAINFQGSIKDQAASQPVNVVIKDPTGGVIFVGNIDVGSLTIGSSGDVGALATTMGNGVSTISSEHDITFYDPVVLGAFSNPTLTVGGNLLFNSTIDGTTGTNESLNISGSGTTTFVGDIGDNIILSSLNVTSTNGVIFQNSQINSPQVTVGSPATIDTPSLVITSQNAIDTFQSIDGAVAGQNQLTIVDPTPSDNGQLTILIQGNIGGNVPLGSLTLSTGIQGATELHLDSVTTTNAGGHSGDQIYTDGVAIFNPNVTFTSTGGNMQFEVGITDNNSSSLSTNGVGATTIFGVATNASRASAFIAGNQIYNTPVLLAGTNPARTSIFNNNGIIDFGGGLSSNGQSILLRDGGGPSASTYEFGGSLNMNGGNINVTGTQGLGDVLFNQMTTAQNWSISGSDSGSLGTIGFTGIDNVIGGDHNDTFAFATGGSVVNITGGATGASVDTSALSGDTNIALTAAGSSAGFNGTSNIGMTSFNNITSFTADNSANNSVTGITGAGETWTITGTGTFSLSAFSKSIGFAGFPTINGSSTGGFDTFNIANNAFGGTINGGGSSNIFNFSTGTIGATILGGGSNTFNFAANQNYSGSITSGSINNAYVFGDNSSFLGTLTGAGSGQNSLIFRSYTTPVTFSFSALGSGSVLDNFSNTIVSFSNFTNAVGNGTGAQAFTGTFDLPTSNSMNVVTLSLAAANHGVLGSYNDPFTFSNINNFVGQSSGIDQVVFNGFSVTTSGTTVNGVPLLFSNFSNISPPIPPTPPTPPPPTPDIGQASSAKSQVISAVYPISTNNSSSSTSSSAVTVYGSPAGLFIADPVTVNISNMIKQQNQIDTDPNNQPIVNLNCN